MSNVNLDYIEELQLTTIPNITKRLNGISTERKEAEEKLSKIKWYTLPFRYNRRYDTSIFSRDYGGDWDSYKRKLAEDWVNETPENTHIGNKFCDWLFRIGSVATIIFIVANIWLKITQPILGDGFLLNVGVLWLTFDIVSGGLSTWYNLIRPNMINKRAIKRKLKSLKSEEKLLSNDLQTKKNLVEQYKIATIDPNKQLAKGKKNSLYRLRQILNDTKTVTLEQVTEPFKSAYARILGKCEELLNMAEENGSIVSEISKIYTIYISDINGILSKTDTTSEENINDLLKNFESYVDRKLNKFKSASTFMVENDISALNKIFTEDLGD